MNGIHARRALAAVAALCLLGGAMAWAQDAAAPSRDDLAKDLLKRAGITHGVCAVLGCDDAALPLALVRSSELTVHVIDHRPEVVEAVAAAVDVDGLWCSRILVEQGAYRQLPYADNTIDLVLSPRGRPVREVLRVLRPGGKAIVALPAGSEATGRTVRLRDGTEVKVEVVSGDDGSRWAEIVKPRPEGMDSWSHWYRGPDNNPVSTDSVIKAPYMTQWSALPYYVAMPATTVAAGGRVFVAIGHMGHHKREWATLNTLVARNGYNGSLLWTRKLPEGFMVQRSAFIATDDAFYMIDGDRALVLDPETGKETGEVRVPGLKEQWEWMAMSDGVMYVLSGEGSAVETTKRERTHSHWSWKDLSPGYYTPRVPWGFGQTLSAYDMKGKRVLWQHREKEHPIDSRALAMGGGKLFYYCPDSHLGCLDAASGSEVWTNDDSDTLQMIETKPPRGVRLLSTPGFVSCCFATYTPEVIFYEEQTKLNLVAVSTDNGKRLWAKRKTTNNPNPIYVDGKVVIGTGPKGNHEVMDPLTGHVLKELPFAKRSCTRLTATPDSFFVRGEGLLRYDRQADKVLVNGALRAGCNDGAVPANGMLYVGPWLCDCNLSLMGMFGLCSSGDFTFDHTATDEKNLRFGEGDVRTVAPLAAAAGDWATYRGNVNRTGSSPAQTPNKADLSWQFKPEVETVPTAPAAAGGLVFVAGQDGKVRAIDSKGSQSWCFRTAGPILTPPTVWNGRVYVGSGDGCVYALEATSGRLLWRFQAAPVDRKIMLYGVLASTWPVNTGVLVQDGVAYAAAGMIDYDGTYVYALDAVTGQIKWQNNSSGHLNAEQRKGVSAQGTMTIHNGRLLLAGGNIISPGAYDLKTGKCLDQPPQNGFPRSNRGQDVCVFEGRVIHGGRLLYSAVEKVVSPAVYSIQGFRGVNAFSRGRVGPVWNEDAMVFLHTPKGQLTCCDVDKLVAALSKAPAPAPGGGRGNPPAVVRLPGRDRRWTCPEVTGDNALSMILTANAVLAVRQTQPEGQDAMLYELLAVSLADGKVMWTQKLPTEPLPGGLVVDGSGRVLVACRDGQTLCYGG